MTTESKATCGECYHTHLPEACSKATQTGSTCGECRVRMTITLADGQMVGVPADAALVECCPLHARAEQMLKALTGLRNLLANEIAWPEDRDTQEWWQMHLDAADAARAAAAKGQPDA